MFHLQCETGSLLFHLQIYTFYLEAYWLAQVPLDSGRRRLPPPAACSSRVVFASAGSRAPRLARAGETQQAWIHFSRHPRLEDLRSHQILVPSDEVRNLPDKVPGIDDGCASGEGAEVMTVGFLTSRRGGGASGTGGLDALDSADDSEV
jgi:hypothetical protein